MICKLIEEKCHYTALFKLFLSVADLEKFDGEDFAVS